MPPHSRHVKVHLRSIQRAEGQYFRLHYTIPGQKETTESLGYLTPEEAEERRGDREAELRLGLSRPASPRPSLRVERVLVEYGEHLTRTYGEDSPHVANTLRRTVPLARHLGALIVSKLGVDTLEEYAHARRREPGGRRGNRIPKRSVVIDELKLLRRALRWYGPRSEETFTVPAMPRLKGIRPDARPKRRLTADELGALARVLLERGAEELGRLVTFMAWCPRRPIAILGLRRRDCARVLASLEANSEGDIWIASDKGDVGLGWSPLLPEARTVLRDQLTSRIGPADALVWTRPDGRRWSNQALRGLILRACKRAGIEFVQPYDLRRFGVTRVLRLCGGDPEAAKAFTGHASSATLMKYAYADRDVVRDVQAGRG